MLRQKRLSLYTATYLLQQDTFTSLIHIKLRIVFRSIEQAINRMPSATSRFNIELVITIRNIPSAAECKPEF